MRQTLTVQSMHAEAGSAYLLGARVLSPYLYGVGIDHSMVYAGVALLLAVTTVVVRAVNTLARP